MNLRQPKLSTWTERYGPWAVITGASDGIGRAIARECARRGLNVVLVARRADRLGDLVRELEAYGNVAKPIRADLSLPSTWDAVAEETAGLDVGLLASCAGFGTSGPFLATNYQTELAMLALNCGAPLALTRRFASRLAERRRGGILLMSSLLAFQGVSNAATYAATKAYNQSLAEGLYADLARVGIDVLASAPGPVASGFAEQANMVMGRAADPAVVARDSLDSLGRTMTVRPGLLAKFLASSLSTLPRGIRIAIMGRIMAGMTKHQTNAKI